NDHTSTFPENTSILPTSISNMSLSDSVIRSFDGIASLSSYDISSTSSVPLPTTIDQAIQLPDSVISNNDCDGNENSRGGQLQQHQQSFSNDVYSTTPNGLKVSPVFGIENIYSGTGVVQSPSASSSGFSLR
ncbi:unnamed protein product, partial [Rotaria magnacalcarata]